MKAYLMHRDGDLDLDAPPPVNEEALTQDLELTTLFSAMARGDAFLFDVARDVVLASLTDPEAIRYRQEILADAIRQPAAMRAMYAVTVQTLTEERRGFYGLYSGASADTILHRSVQVMGLFVTGLRSLRAIADEHAGTVRSEGLRRFFAMLASELNDDYFALVEQHLEELRFRRGVVISAQLGQGLQGRDIVLHRLAAPASWMGRLTQRRRTPSHSFQLADRDDAGLQALEKLRAKGINLAANALAQSADHVKSFLLMLRAELAFYVGCLNLHETLAEKGEPVCFPDPAPSSELELSVRSLYDVCLTLHLKDRAVGNDAEATGKRLVVITGANRGGKSTFLRGLGLAQLMMQCGMFVAAERFQADVRDGIFTHYRREEDPGLEMGKLDEELARMSGIVDTISPRSMLLCNESFASTNEREGSEIARQVVEALLASGVKVGFVTHLYDLAASFHRDRASDALFLRAERLDDGTRTFRVVEGEPLPTSHGEDLYRRIFGTDRPEEADAGG